MKEKIFKWFWKRWIRESKVAEITGWRSAILVSPTNGRSRCVFMFPWERCGRPWWQVRRELIPDIIKIIKGE